MRPTVLIVSAWEPELAPLRRWLRTAAGCPAAGAVALRPVGVGLIEAALGTAQALTELRPRQVIFTGTAGVYAGAKRRFPLGAVAVAESLALVSTAAVRGDGYLPPPLPTTVTSAAALRAQLLTPASGARAAAIACPLAITRTAALGRRIARTTGAALENLEAFAAARAAAAARIPFGAVLAIANTVGPDGHTEWRAHHQKASAAACRLIADWLTRTAEGR